MMALGAYAIGWVLAPVLAVDHAADDETHRPQRAAPVVRVETTEADSQLAAWLLVDHESALAISQLARERAQDGGVRRLAQLAVDDHTRRVQQLRPFAGTMLGQLDKASRDAALAAKVHRANVNSTPTEVGATAHYPALPVPRDRSPDADLYLLELKRSLGQQRITSTQVLFDEQSRDDFDLFYLEQQIAAYREMLDTLLVFEGRASTELADVIAEAVVSVREHGEHAQELARTLDNSASETTFRPLLSGK